MLADATRRENSREMAPDPSEQKIETHRKQNTKPADRGMGGNQNNTEANKKLPDSEEKEGEVTAPAVSLPRFPAS